MTETHKVRVRWRVVPLSGLVLLAVTLPYTPACSTRSDMQPVSAGLSLRQTDAVTPRPRGDATYLEQHRLLMHDASQRPVDVLFLGDSITAGWTDVGLDVWQQAFPDGSAAHMAIAGDQTQWLRWRIEQGALDKLNPRVVVLMIGTNNLKSGPTRMPVDEAAAGVDAVVNAIRTRLPDSRLLLVSVLPRQPHYPWMADTVTRMNQHLAELAARRGCAFIDLAPEFLDATQDPPRLRSELYQSDMLHLSAAGYAAWADALEPMLAQP